MSNQLKIYSILTVALLINSCKTSFDEPRYNSGSIDLSRYVAVGTSLTAGVTDGALSKDGQENSLATIIQERFAKADDAVDFKIPFLTGANGADGVFPSLTMPSATTPRLILRYVSDCKGTNVSPVLITDPNNNNTDFYNNPIGSQGPFNNMGVPFAKSFNAIAPSYGQTSSFLTKGNPFYYRMAKNPGTSTMMSDAVDQSPTFFTFEIGINDVMLYAIHGGDSASALNEFYYLTDINLFTISVDSAVKKLAATGAKGVISNIPDITAFPFFTTIPFNGLMLDDSEATVFNNMAAALFPGSNLSFSAGANAYVIKDNSAPNQLRQAKAGELICLSVPSDSLKGCGPDGIAWGTPAKPLDNLYVLDQTEVGNVVYFTEQYNAAISSIAQKYKVPLVDMNSFFNSVKNGTYFNGVKYSLKFKTGNTISLDGIHPTARGYALLANEFIKTINAFYGSNIPPADANKYKGISFP